MEHAKRFQTFCPRRGIRAEEYANRVVRLDDDLDALAGIRFRPSTGVFFVDLVATSRPLVDAAELVRAAGVLAEEFAAFEPAWLRLYAADERFAVDGRLVGDFVVAARVAELAARPASERVTAARRRAAEVFDDYVRVYAEFHAETPRNAELAHVEDRETLERWERDGGVFEVLVGGESAGFCGARRWNRYGVRGWCAAEIVMARRFRGRGLAPSVHRRMAAAIDAAPGDALWAEVHEENAPSLRAGLSAGYAVIGRVLRIPLQAPNWRR